MSAILDSEKVVKIEKLEEANKPLVESDSTVFYEVLDETLEILNASGLPYVLMGGISATAHGGSRFTHDIDIFVKLMDAEKTLEVLEQHGFQTEKTDPKWLYKGFKKNVLVDVIFKSTGEIYLDEEMIERSRLADFNGRSVRVLAPEDLFVIKAIVLNEHTLMYDDRIRRHLVDLLSVIRAGNLDWEYLIKRARYGPRRVLGMLLFAQSMDLLVPNTVIKNLINTLEIS